MSTLTQKLYYSVPVALQNALVSAYALARARKRYGGRYAHLVREARTALTLREDEVRSYQLRQLRTMLTHAQALVPFYRRLFGEVGFDVDAFERLEDLYRLPVLTKEAVRANAAALRADGTRPFWTNETSGSTGTPLTVALSAEAYQLTMALLVLHEEDHGIVPADRRATFAGRLVQPVDDDRPPFWRFNWAERQMLCSAYHLSDRNLPAYLDALAAFAPREIIGYPSAIATVASFCLSSGRRPRLPLKAVVTNSESLLDWQRDAIERAFEIPVFDYYGTAEAVVFAGQCTEGRYHPHPMMGVAEVVDDRGHPAAPGEAGRLVCTTLCNEAMPLIRYEVGDLVVVAEGPCRCGRPGSTWSTVVGRVDDVVVTPEGHRVGRLDHVFKGVSAVREAQIVQTSSDRLAIRIVPDAGYSEAVAALIVRNTRERVGSTMRVDLEQVDQIPRTSRGKFKAVIVERSSPARMES